MCLARLRAVEHGMWRLLWVVWEGWSMDCRKWKNLKAVRGVRLSKEKEASLEEGTHIHSGQV